MNCFGYSFSKHLTLLSFFFASSSFASQPSFALPGQHGNSYRVDWESPEGKNFSAWIQSMWARKIPVGFVRVVKNARAAGTHYEFLEEQPKQPLHLELALHTLSFTPGETTPTVISSLFPPDQRKAISHRMPARFHDHTPQAPLLTPYHPYPCAPYQFGPPPYAPHPYADPYLPVPGQQFFPPQFAMGSHTAEHQPPIAPEKAAPAINEFLLTYIRTASPETRLNIVAFISECSSSSETFDLTPALRTLLLKTPPALHAEIIRLCSLPVSPASTSSEPATPATTAKSPAPAVIPAPPAVKSQPEGVVAAPSIITPAPIVETAKETDSPSTPAKPSDDNKKVSENDAVPSVSTMTSLERHKTQRPTTKGTEQEKDNAPAPVQHKPAPSLTNPWDKKPASVLHSALAQKVNPPAATPPKEEWKTVGPKASTPTPAAPAQGQRPPSKTTSTTPHGSNHSSQASKPAQQRPAEKKSPSAVTTSSTPAPQPATKQAASSAPAPETTAKAEPLAQPGKSARRKRNNDEFFLAAATVAVERKEEKTSSKPSALSSTGGHAEDGDTPQAPAPTIATESPDGKTATSRGLTSRERCKAQRAAQKQAEQEAHLAAAAAQAERTAQEVAHYAKMQSALESDDLAKAQQLLLAGDSTRPLYLVHMVGLVTHLRGKVGDFSPVTEAALALINQKKADGSWKTIAKDDRIALMSHVAHCAVEKTVRDRFLEACKDAGDIECSLQWYALKLQELEKCGSPLAECQERSRRQCLHQEANAFIARYAEDAFATRITEFYKIILLTLQHRCQKMELGNPEEKVCIILAEAEKLLPVDRYRELMDFLDQFPIVITDPKLLNIVAAAPVGRETAALASAEAIERVFEKQSLHESLNLAQRYLGRMACTAEKMRTIEQMEGYPLAQFLLLSVIIEQQQPACSLVEITAPLFNRKLTPYLMVLEQACPEADAVSKAKNQNNQALLARLRTLQKALESIESTVREKQRLQIQGKFFTPLVELFSELNRFDDADYERRGAKAAKLLQDNIVPLISSPADLEQFMLCLHQYGAHPDYANVSEKLGSGIQACSQQRDLPLCVQQTDAMRMQSLQREVSSKNTLVQIAKQFQQELRTWLNAHVAEPAYFPQAIHYTTQLFKKCTTQQQALKILASVQGEPEAVLYLKGFICSLNHDDARGIAKLTRTPQLDTIVKIIDQTITTYSSKHDDSFILKAYVSFLQALQRELVTPLLGTTPQPPVVPAKMRRLERGSGRLVQPDAALAEKVVGWHKSDIEDLCREATMGNYTAAVERVAQALEGQPTAVAQVMNILIDQQDPFTQTCAFICLFVLLKHITMNTKDVVDLIKLYYPLIEMTVGDSTTNAAHRNFALSLRKTTEEFLKTNGLVDAVFGDAIFNPYIARITALCADLAFAQDDEKKSAVSTELNKIAKELQQGKMAPICYAFRRFGSSQLKAFVKSDECTLDKETRDLLLVMCI